MQNDIPESEYDLIFVFWTLLVTRSFFTSGWEWPKMGILGNQASA